MKKISENPYVLTVEIENTILKEVDEEKIKQIEEREKENITYYGVKTPIVRDIGKLYFNKLKEIGITDIDDIAIFCERLLERKISELRTIAFQWFFRVKKQYEKKHFKILERWLKTYVTGWGSTDDLCTHALGYFLYTFPEYAKTTQQWSKSLNVWVRRAAAVSLIYGLRRGKFKPQCFEVADSLVNDTEKYVLKGYGWMLKEASKHFQEKVFNYVMKNKERMPRLSLRYAIEKMPKELKIKAMKK